MVISRLFLSLSAVAGLILMVVSGVVIATSPTSTDPAAQVTRYGYVPEPFTIVGHPLDAWFFLGLFGLVLVIGSLGMIVFSRRGNFRTVGIYSQDADLLESGRAEPKRWLHH